MNQVEYDVLLKKYEFLNEKIVSLRRENFNLHCIIAQLSDENEQNKKIIEHLKEKFEESPCKQQYQKMDHISPINIEQTSEKQFVNPTYLKEPQFQYQKLNQFQIIQELIDPMLKDPKMFFDLNEIISNTDDSPQLRLSIIKSEKKLEQCETIIEKWYKRSKQILKCRNQLKSQIDSFITELSPDHNLFDKNIEIRSLLQTLLEFLNDNQKYFEMQSFSILNAFQLPLKNFFKNELTKYKESKKRFYNCLNDFEVLQHKIFNQKKQSIKESQLTQQYEKLKSLQQIYEQQKLDHIKILNQTNFNLNIEIMDKLTTLHLSSLAYLTSSYNLIYSSEQAINYFSSNYQHKLRNFNSIDLNIFQQNQTNNLFMNGYVFKKGLKEIKKKYYEIDKGILYKIKFEKNDTNVRKKEISNLQICSIKEVQDLNFPHMFEISCPNRQKPLALIFNSQQIAAYWVGCIKTSIEAMLQGKSFTAPQSRQSILKSNYQKKIETIILLNVCADCGASLPSWISLNLCVIICIECSGIHRKLGTHTSRIRSLKLDNIENDCIDFFQQYGTQTINQIWEECIIDQYEMKPNSNSQQLIKEQFIKLKYEEKRFINKDKSIQYDMIENIKNQNLLSIFKNIITHQIDLKQIIKYELQQTTYLHLACQYTNTNIIYLLIQLGSDLDTIDEQSRKPVDIAMLYKKDQILDQLIQKLAK